MGCICWKLDPVTSRVGGWPDLMAFYGGEWFAIEVKRSRTAPFRPLQEAQLERINKMNPGHGIVVFPENWQEEKARIKEVLKKTKLPPDWDDTEELLDKVTHPVNIS